MYSVAIYLVDKAYGGPEEGGWWFTYGHPIDEVLEELPRYYQLPKYFHDENMAVLHANNLNRSLDATVNKGRREISSMASEGQYWARVEEGHPKPFPERRPRYE